MTLSEMRAEAEAAISDGDERMPLVLPRGVRPPKFPRGELLCENTDGNHVRSYRPERVLAWVEWAEKEILR